MISVRIRLLNWLGLKPPRRGRSRQSNRHNTFPVVPAHSRVAWQGRCFRHRPHEPCCQRAAPASGECVGGHRIYQHGFDEDRNPGVRRGSRETEFTAFSSRKRKLLPAPGCTAHPRAEPNAAEEQPTLFDAHPFQGFFITVPAAALGTVAAAKTPAQRPAYLPSGNFAANSAWLVAAVMAYNLTRTAGVLAVGAFAKARTVTIRSKLTNTARPDRCQGRKNTTSPARLSWCSIQIPVADWGLGAA